MMKMVLPLLALSVLATGTASAQSLNDPRILSVTYQDGMVLVARITDQKEVLLRRPTSPQLRAWAKGVSDKYDQAFRELIGL